MERINTGKTELPTSKSEKYKTFFNFLFHLKEAEELPCHLNH